MKSIRLVAVLILTIGQLSVLAQEICDNALDDDNDGLIDLNDDDCDCSGFGNTSSLESLIPNSSFEDQNCCPQGYSSAGSADYLNNCAQSWVQASTPTSDYWHMCGADGSPADGGAALPPPDGQGFVGFINMAGWQEYVGACLNQTMLTGQEYDLSFFMGYTNSSAALDLTFYGTSTCAELPFSGNDCPTGQGNWVELGTTPVGGPLGWEPITFTFTPTTDINALVIGAGCNTGGARAYYYIDDLNLISTELFEVLHLDRSGTWCDNDILLTASNDTTIGTFQWYRDGIALVGETFDELDVSGNNYGEGDYTIGLLINDQCESLTTTIVAPEIPVASASVTGACDLSDIVFTDESTLSTGNIVNWDWEFGDLNTSIIQNPNYQYATAGSYDITLTVTTDSNCVDTWQGIVDVSPNPVADFSFVAGCLGAQSIFADLSTVNAPANINQWTWDFGDLNGSSDQNPAHQFSSMNSFDVELVIETADGCKDSITSTIDVYPSPEVDVSAIPECALDAVQFTNLSGISAGAIATHNWDFGDLASSAVNVPNHTYSTSGLYTIVYTATSDQGCISDTTFALASFPNPITEFTATEVCFGEEIELNNTSSVIAPGIIDTYELDFGDSSPTQNAVPPSYQYENPGDYVLELIVTTTDGCDDTLEVATVTHNLPIALFDFTNVCEDDSVLYTDQSIIPIGTISSWLWNFGNGQTSILQDPNYQSYFEDNTYPVSLIITSEFACSDTLEETIEIFPVPVADFTFDSVCFPLEIQFSDLSEPNGAYPITSWQWLFSDAQTSALQNPSIDFGIPGIFSADLQISNDLGCKGGVADGDAVVHPLPVAEFPDDLSACLEESIDFLDQSFITPVTNDVITDWLWNFDDLVTTSDNSPNHLYLAPSIYNVQLVIETNNGCVDNVVHAVEVFPLPVVDFETVPAIGCAPLRVQFIDQSSIDAPYNLGTWDWYLGADSLLASSQNTFYVYDPEMGPIDIAVYDIGVTVTSLNGCVTNLYRPNHLTVYPKPDALFSVDDDVKDILKPVFEFTDLSSENVTAWEWDFGDGTFDYVQNPEHTFPEIGTFPIELIVETQYGCLDTIGDEIKVKPIFNFYVPNSFTPDANGINDFFFGEGEGYTTYKMWVYDRWGEELFFSEENTYKWDGSFKGTQVQEGVYNYRFYLLDWQGHDHQYKGHVTLHR